MRAIREGKFPIGRALILSLERRKETILYFELESSLLRWYSHTRILVKDQTADEKDTQGIRHDETS